MNQNDYLNFLLKQIEDKMNQKYFNICNRTVYDLMGTSEQGDVEIANNTLSRLLV
jgi:hypothetical protein